MSLLFSLVLVLAVVLAIYIIRVEILAYRINRLEREVDGRVRPRLHELSNKMTLLARELDEREHQ